MSVAVEPVTGTIDQALRHASRLLLKAPALALEQLEEVDQAAPGHPGALLLLAKACRACGEPDRAEQAARRLLDQAPGAGVALRELALIGLMRDDLGGAARFLEEAVASDPHDAGAWAILADLGRLSGDTAGAEAARRLSIAGAVHDRDCLEAALALSEERLADAEHLLRLRLRDYPTEVATIRMMAELATRLGRLAEAETLLRRALQIAPFFPGARELLARNLQRGNRPVEAMTEVDALLADDPGNPSFRMLKASLLVKIGDQAAARAVYEDLLAAYPKQAKAWMSLGHVLKTLGRQEEGVSAYRRAIAEQPTLGEAWWSLANLKTVRFSSEDVAAMEAALAQRAADDDRLHLHFALGKAREDAGEDEAAVRHWRAGNALRRQSLPYDAEEAHHGIIRAKTFFQTGVLRPARGCPAADPIFIVGMPRSGSTLVEQILASHSQIEGTMELPDMMEIAGRLASDAKRAGQAYPDVLATLPVEGLHALGQEYLDRTRVYRKTGRPCFIDKMPNNWAHVGLIRMILPKARIIDARRHPVGCCLSVWKQHFARGQAFSYDLVDLARYYRDYTDLMDHFDAVMPGVVHRVIYERVVADSEAEVRRLLDYLGLPFEDSCLTFWKNDRAVRTASSEQVRKPIFSDAVDHWRRFEPWLGPLLTQLDPVIRAYPA